MLIFEGFFLIGAIERKCTKEYKLWHVVWTKIHKNIFMNIIESMSSHEGICYWMIFESKRHDIIINVGQFTLWWWKILIENSVNTQPSLQMSKLSQYGRKLFTLRLHHSSIQTVGISPTFTAFQFANGPCRSVSSFALKSEQASTQ